MKKFFFDCGTRDQTASVAFLALRVLTGLMMLIGHGIPKIQAYGSLKAFFFVPNFLPDTPMWRSICLIACICAEVGGALLLIFGLMARPAAFLIGLCMVGAAFGVRAMSPWFETYPTLVENKELSVVYLIVMIGIILGGAGAWSLDAVIVKERRNRRW